MAAILARSPIGVNAVPLKPPRTLANAHNLSVTGAEVTISPPLGHPPGRIATA